MGSKRRDRSEYDRQKSKKHKRERSPLPAKRELLIAAAFGDRQLCKALLRRGADIHWCDGELTTPLHAASREGHVSVVKSLLKRGANAAAQDLRGDSAAHLAARRGHLDVLAVLLKAKSSIGIDEPNDKGETVEALTSAAMARKDAEQSLAAEREAEKHRPRGYGSSENENNGGEDWEERLRREMSPGEGGGVYYSSEWHADEYETADEYARRIWQEMRAKKRAEEETAAARARAAAKREEKTAETADAARKHAEKESRRILGEQQAADAAWRAAVAAGAAGPKLASYEARFEFFCTKSAESKISFADVPWILLPAAETATVQELHRVLMHGAQSQEGRKKVLRRELMRWHPDKFEAKFGRRLAEGDREQIIKKVTQTSQLLTVILGDQQQ